MPNEAVVHLVMVAGRARKNIPPPEHFVHNIHISPHHRATQTRVLHEDLGAAVDPLERVTDLPVAGQLKDQTPAESEDVVQRKLVICVAWATFIWAALDLDQPMQYTCLFLRFVDASNVNSAKCNIWQLRWILAPTAGGKNTELTR